MLESFTEYVSAVEERLGIRPGFFNELIREDDWGFVIKLHAFVEAALTDTICSVLGHSELSDTVARLDTANGQCGKLAFAKALGILDRPQRRFIAALCTLRNRLAHDVRSAEFSFADYMDSLSEQARYEFCVSLSLDGMFRDEYAEGEIQLISLVNETPKFGICYTASILVTHLFGCCAQGDADQAFRTLGERLVSRTLDAMDAVRDGKSPS